MKPDVLIIGGGAIGLSLAYELAGQGARVRVVDRGQLGQESSWAGAGIIPPGSADPQAHSLDQLAALGAKLHPEWSQQLRAETGIDNGYRPCGGLYLARDAATHKELESFRITWRTQGITFHTLTPGQLADVEPNLAPPLAIDLLRDEAQLRNPRHVKALAIACQRRGVELSPGIEAGDFVASGTRITAVDTTGGKIEAGQVCICGGAWSRLIASRLGVSLGVRPIRGQIVLLDRGATVLNHIINDGPRYLVPRDDGRVLVGSTEEDVGFEKRNTAEALRGLFEFAVSLVPQLGAARFERAWAGLRPASLDGLPYLGRVPRYDNAWLAAGHFRAGLSMSCSTAVVMAQAMLGKQPQIDLTPLRVDRERAA